MEELRPEDLEELVQELAEEYGAPEPPPPEVEELLRELQSGSDGQARREAAEQLGKLDTSSPRIVQALIVAQKSDTHAVVRDAAAKSLRAPVHRTCLQGYPDLIKATERALRRRPRSYSSGEPTELVGYLSFLVSLGAELAGGRPSPGRWISRKEADHRTFHEEETLSYRIGAALGALFVRIRPSRTRRPNSLTSAEEARHRTSDQPLSYYTGAALGALYVRIKRSFTKRLASVSRGEPGAVEPQAPSKPSLASEGDQTSDCPACGAWNPPGSEHCGECGAPLESTQLITYKAAWTTDQKCGPGTKTHYDIALAAALAKLRAPQAGFGIMNEVADWFGAMAYTQECPVEMSICGIRSYSIGAEGTMNIMRLIIDRELLGAEFLPYRH